MAIIPACLLLFAYLSVGGATREAADGEFPFQVSVQTLENRHLCGGALITPRWVLTVSSCLKYQNRVRVAYGSADSNMPLGVAHSTRIIPEVGLSLNIRNSLALVELDKPVAVSDRVKPAGLPTPRAELRNTTKLSGWKVSTVVDVPPNLHVSDVYYVIPKDCKTSIGTPVHLDQDEFCGMDEDPTRPLFNPGTTVSKGGIVLGIMSSAPMSAHQPSIYVKVSEHGDWIRSSLGSDAGEVNWVDEVPKDSGPRTAVSLALVGVCVGFLRFF